MNRIFIEPTKESHVVISGEDAKHLQVLRANGGDILPISDGKGRLYDGEVVNVTSHTYELKLFNERPAEKEKHSVILYQALCKGDKNEFIIQKSVELGATEIVFFVSDTCIAKPNGKENAKLDRYEKVARLAAMQSGREIVPTVRGFLSFDQMMQEVKGGQTLFFYEKAEKKLSEALKTVQPESPVRMIVGCEGGFLEKEAQSLLSAGVEPLSLGSRILRAETAPIVGLSVLMAQLGEI